MSEFPKVGLVLSGGGAKGAYQVGVLRALQEMGTQVDMVSGASIGALNGGVLAGAPNFNEGVARVEHLWKTLLETSPLKVDTNIKPSTYIKLMLAAGAILAPHLKLISLLRLVVGAGVSAQTGTDDISVLSDEPLAKLMDKYLDTTGLSKGLPLYVSVYESTGSVNDLVQCFVAAAGLKETPDSKFIHLQSKPTNEQRNILLASAALPMVFKAREIDGKKYSDGGQGGWSKSQGNTPIQPLIDAGCKLIIVTHLSDGSLWSRHDFPDVTVLEIRPQSTMARAEGFGGGVKDLLGFDAEKIPSWIEQGYNDTLHCMGRVKHAIQSLGSLDESKENLKDSERKGDQADSNLKNMMSKIR